MDPTATGSGTVPDNTLAAKMDDDAVLKVVSSCGALALCGLVVGSLLGSPWPAALVACAICVMGLGGAYFAVSRR